MEQAKAIIFYLLPAIFGVLGLFHFYWAFGGKALIEFVNPEKEGKSVFLPPAITGLISAGFFGSAWVVLAFGGLLETTVAPEQLRYGMLGVLGLLLARMIGDFKFVGIMKTQRGGKFSIYDDKIYSPLCGLIGLLMAVLLRQ